MSSARSTATPPGAARAALGSRRRTRAWACGARSGPTARARWADTAAMGEARLADDSVGIEVEGEGRGHDADVELPPLGHLQEVGPAGEPVPGRAAGEHDLQQDLLRPEDGLAVAGE